MKTNKKLESLKSFKELNSADMIWGSGRGGTSSCGSNVHPDLKDPYTSIPELKDPFI